GVSRHPTDVAADQRMLMLRRIEERATLLRPDAGAQAIANPQRYLADGARLRIRERLIHGRAIQWGQRQRRVPEIEYDQRNQQPLNDRRSQPTLRSRNADDAHDGE